MKRAVGRYKNLTDTNWLTKVYKDKFVVEDGVVRLKRPGTASTSGNTNLVSPNLDNTNLVSSSLGPPTREGGSSSSRLPTGYSVPALAFRGVVEQPGKRAAQQEAKRQAEALKAQKRQERRDAWADKQVQKQMKELDRIVKNFK